MQVAISDAYTNAKFPIFFVNSLLQGKFEAAGMNLSRFVINSTLGVGGLLDVASNAGVPKHEEDFGQTLGTWGMNPGPYLVLPLLGPSSVRDGAGQAVDSPLRIWPFFVPWWQSLAISGGEAVNWRSMNIEEIRSVRKQALDYYVLVRNAYLQRREVLVRDGDPDAETDAAGETEDDLYFYDFEDDE